MTPRLVLKDTVELETRRAVLARLGAFDQAMLGPLDIRPVTVLIEEEAGIGGGLWGYTAWQWLTMEILFVPEPLRRSGIGSALVRQAEAEALRRGCRGAWLDTFSPEARRFYERLGYRLFGQLPAYPDGHQRFFLEKQFDSRRIRD